MFNVLFIRVGISCKAFTEIQDKILKGMWRFINFLSLTSFALWVLYAPSPSLEQTLCIN